MIELEHQWLRDGSKQKVDLTDGSLIRLTISSKPISHIFSSLKGFHPSLLSQDFQNNNAESLISKKLIMKKARRRNGLRPFRSSLEMLC